MTGTIRRMSKRNVWEIAADAGKHKNGQRRRLYRTVHGTKTEAHRKLRGLLAEAERLRAEGAVHNPSPVLVADWLGTWLSDFVHRSRAVTTYERYSTVARRQSIPNIGAVALTELAPRQIHDMDLVLLDSGLSPRTVQIAHTVLSGACREALKLEMIERNPVAASSWPSAPKPEIYVPEACLVSALLRLAQEECHSLSVFLHTKVYTGMRRGEIMALRWNNVDFDRGTVRVVESAVKTREHGMIVKRPKTVNAVRTIDLDNRTVALLRRHRDAQIEAGIGDGRSSLVFPAADGGLMKPTTMTRQLKRLGKLVGAPTVTFHSLRHFHATMLLQQGQNIIVVSKRLGHSSVTVMLNTYGHVLSGWQRDSAEAFARAMEDAA